MYMNKCAENNINSSSTNQRIARNTAYLYFRMFITMAVSLYTSRVSLQVLGVEDFGIYNVVAGFVGMLAFFTSSLSNASQRYISIGLGKNNIEETKLAFRQSNTILTLFSLAVIVIAESIGLWFVVNKLVIPPERMSAALWVYHSSVIMVICSIVQVTFIASIISHERMGIYAYIALFEVFAKLAICLVLLKTEGDHLIQYAILMAFFSIIILLFYLFYCRKFSEEFSLGFIWDKLLVKSMSKFIGANLYGCLAYAGGVQGTNILLNMFFGPVVNASRGIANQVSNVVVRFSENVMTAVKPQILKSYSCGDIDYMFKLINKSTKLSFFISCLITIPLIFETPFLLQLWLGFVPDYSIPFTRLVLIDALIAVLCNPLWIATNATGNIKRNQIYGRTLTLLSLPVGYVMLKIYPNPNLVMALIAFMTLIYWLYCVYDIQLQLKFDVKQYLLQSILPGLGLVAVMSFIGTIITYIFKIDPVYMFFVRGAIVVLSGLMISYAMLDNAEKYMVNELVFTLLNKIKKTK